MAATALEEAGVCKKRYIRRNKMKLTDKIREMNPVKRKRILGMLVILIAFIAFGKMAQLLILSPDERESAKRKNMNTVQEEEKDLPIQDGTGKNLTVNTKINYDMPKEIKERIDFKKFNKSFEKFVDDNNLGTENTTATSDGMFTENYNTGEKSFSLRLNDYHSTLVLVVVKSDGSFTYQYT